MSSSIRCPSSLIADQSAGSSVSSSTNSVSVFMAVKLAPHPASPRWGEEFGPLPTFPTSRDRLPNGGRSIESIEYFISTSSCDDLAELTTRFLLTGQSWLENFANVYRISEKK